MRINAFHFAAGSNEPAPRQAQLCAVIKIARLRSSWFHCACGYVQERHRKTPEVGFIFDFAELERKLRQTAENMQFFITVADEPRSIHVFAGRWSGSFRMLR